MIEHVNNYNVNTISHVKCLPVSICKLKQNNHPSYTTNKIIVECVVCIIFLLLLN